MKRPKVVVLGEFQLKIFLLFSSWKRTYAPHKYASWNLLFFWYYKSPSYIWFLCLCWQSLNETHVPDTLLERLVTNTTEFPPVCAVIGGILGQVLTSFHCVVKVFVIFNWRGWLHVSGGYQSNFWKRRPPQEFFLFWCFRWEGHYRRHLSELINGWIFGNLNQGRKILPKTAQKTSKILRSLRRNWPFLLTIHIVS